MTWLNDLLLECRDRLQDLGGDVDDPEEFWKTNDDSPQFFWKNRELIRALNQTLTEKGRREPIHDAIGTTFKIDLVANQPDYIHDSRILIIDGLTLESDGRQLLKTDIKSLDYKTQYGTTWRERDPSLPEQYVLDIDTRTITLFPAPSNLYASDFLLVYCQYTPYASYTTGDITTNPVITDIGHRDAVLWGMQYYLYQKRGDDTFRPELADHARRMFTELVGPPVSEQVLYNRRINADSRTRILPHPYTPRIKQSRTYRENRKARSL